MTSAGIVDPLVSSSAYIIVDQGDPIARVINRAFHHRSWLFLVVQVALGLMMSVFVIPQTWGQLRPTAPFNFALFESDAAFVWCLLCPYVGLAYLWQFDNIPRLFNDLYANGVTGMSVSEYDAFVLETNHVYSFRRWFVLLALGSIPFWCIYIYEVLSVPGALSFSAIIALWIFYFTVQYIQALCLFCYLLRHAVAWYRLRVLLKEDHVVPQRLLAHLDGLGGFAPITRFVSATFLVSVTVLSIFVLRFVSSNTIIPEFRGDPGIVGYIVVGVINVTIVPFVVLHPLRMAFRIIRKAKVRLSYELERSSGNLIAQLFGALSAPGGSDIADVVTLRELGEVIEARDRIHAIIDDLPDSIFELRIKSLLVTLLAAAVPVLVGIGLPLLPAAIQSIAALVMG